MLLIESKLSIVNLCTSKHFKIRSFVHSLVNYYAFSNGFIHKFSFNYYYSKDTRKVMQEFLRVGQFRDLLSLAVHISTKTCDLPYAGEVTFQFANERLKLNTEAHQQLCVCAEPTRSRVVILVFNAFPFLIKIALSCL